MRVGKVIRYVTGLLLAVALLLAPVGFLPARVQAAINPVDLELGGEGATPWSINNIKPGDSGTKTVELHNAGSEDGFVTIWVSDIISSEGNNPESETGNTTEPGELDKYLVLGLAADGLTSGMNLPVIFNSLPQSVSDPKYIELIPLKASNSANLQWQWQMPAPTGNDAQGDGISFTINYLFREFQITDVSAVVTPAGAFTKNVTAVSDSTKGKVAINQDTIGKSKEREPIHELWIIEIDKEPSAPSPTTTTIGPQYELGPEGTTFDPPVILTLTYNPDDIPDRANESDLVIAWWDKDAGRWVELKGSTVNILNHTVSAPVSHFSRYTIIASIPPPPPPPEPIESPEEPSPPVVSEEVIAPSPRLLEVDMLGKTGAVKIDIDGTVGEPLRLTDPGGNFILDVDRGTRITGADGVELSRLELGTTDESIVVPDDMVALSPIYRLSGYTPSMEDTRINFTPPARLTISYDPKNLPENVFPPFIVRWTPDEGLIRLEPPLGSVVEIGKAKAEISHASLFAVMAELAPPPPPLPARFEASNLIINPGQAQLGQPVAISLTITNEGATEGSFELHLIIDGIVRMVQEITLAGKSSETLTFEISNLAVGKHQVKIAGLTEQFRIVRMVTPPGELIVNWLVIDLSVAAALAMGALVLYLVTRRSRQTLFK